MDSLWVSLFYIISILIFGDTNILNNIDQTLFFVTVGLIVAFVIEKTSLRSKRWKYANTMPIVFGVGVTPLLQLAVTGLLTFFYLFFI